MRMQLDLPEAKVNELKLLMNEAGIETYKELFNNALTLLEWSVDQTKAGRAIASLDEENEKYRVLLMPILETLAKREKKKKTDKAAALSASASSMNFAVG